MSGNRFSGVMISHYKIAFLSYTGMGIFFKKSEFQAELNQYGISDPERKGEKRITAWKKTVN